jgi:outer membrane protein
VGIDIPVNDSGLGLALDAKRCFTGTTAQFFAGDTR